MSEAPERIWAVPLEMHGAVMVGGWADTIRQCPNGTEYVRVDIHANTLATNAALVKWFEEARVVLHFYADFHENPNDGPWGVNSQDFGTAARAFLSGGE